MAAMTSARIVGMGGYQPGEPITNDVLERLVGGLPDDVMAGLSIERRFWLVDPETGEHRESNSDMAVEASRRALASAGVDAADVDLMLLATGTPDHTLPPTVNLVQEKLGLEKCATLEIRSAGAGWVQALELARLYLEPGLYRTALVIGSEAISPVLVQYYLGKEPNKIRVRNRMPLYMFGDGAGAAVVTAEEGGGDGGLLGGAMRAIGGKRKPGIQTFGGDTHAPMHEQREQKVVVDLRVDVVGAGEFTPQMVVEALADTLERTGIPVESVDHCLIPEGNVGWMLAALDAAGLRTAEWDALQGKIFDNLSQMGACGCAAVPLFADHAWRSGLIQPGHRVMLVGVEATKWVYAGELVDWTAPTPARSP
jgi:3-oxoacyl-[acyl-carrier-protein] synthase-3